LQAGKPGLGVASAPRDVVGPGSRPAVQQQSSSLDRGGSRWREEERELAPGESRLLRTPSQGASRPWNEKGVQSQQQQPAVQQQPQAAASGARFSGKPDEFRAPPGRGWDAQGGAAKTEVRAQRRKTLSALSTGPSACPPRHCHAPARATAARRVRSRASAAR